MTAVLTLLSSVLLGSSVAHAGVPVVYDGGAASEVVTFAAGRTGLPAEQLEATPLSQLLSALPRATGAATVRHCSRPPTRAPELRAHLVRAEAAWREGDVSTAMDHLDLGISGLGCLSERVDAKVAARLFLLRGGLLARDGRDEDAAAELRTALALWPEATWDEWLPSYGRDVLAAVKAASTRSVLTFLPAAASTGPWLDGRPTTPGQALSVGPGLHLLQVPGTGGLRTAWLTVDADAELVVPGSFRRPVLERLSGAENHWEVGTLILSTLGVEAAYVAAGGGLWLVEREDATIHVATLIVPPKVEEPKETGRRRRGR
jgi:hypothetical protein